MTYTASHTYTATDTKKVLSSFEADLTMLARSSGAMTERAALDTAHDVTLFALLGYLTSIVVALEDASGIVRCFREYSASLDANGWHNDDPRGNRWPQYPGGRLVLQVHNNADWNALPLETRLAVQVQAGFRDRWTPAEKALSHGQLSSVGTRVYASGGYGLAGKEYR